MSCFITNRLPFGVEFTKVQVVDHRGYVTAETTDPELLSNNYLALNSSVALSISLGLPPYITDVEQWEVHWFIEIAEEQYVIKSSYGTSPWW